MQDILLKRMVDVFLSLLNMPTAKRANQITKTDRQAIIDMLKGLPLTITGSLPIEEAMVRISEVFIRSTLLPQGQSSQPGL